MNRRVALWVLLVTGCVHQFRGATSADEAQCRNLARAITGASGGLHYADAYDDCMRGKGLREEDE